MEKEVSTPPQVKHKGRVSSWPSKKREICNQGHKKKASGKTAFSLMAWSFVLYGHSDHDLERLGEIALCSTPLKVNARYVKLNMSNPLQNWGHI